MSQLAMDLAARDVVLTEHQRKGLVKWLEWRMYRLARPGDPVSANNARAILKAWNLTEIDARLLGGVFPSARWQQVGETHSDSGRCHARKIRTFAPRPEVVVDWVVRPEWIAERLSWQGGERETKRYMGYDPE
jgi:hypothetical protein